uniref:Integrase catalytic domain-containing protein n=1 Tax=Clytia hemisphaerica TaxID=252671 RepID=A0A7M5XDJ8_9CNID
TDNRLPRAIEDKDYELLVKIIQNDGRNMVRGRERTNQDRRVARLYLSGNYDIERTYDPIKEDDGEMLVFRSDGRSLIVPKISDVETIISFFHKKYKGENALKLEKRIAKLYTGISRHRIQNWINNDREHCSKNPVFANKDLLQPVQAEMPMEVIQIDLVDFTNFKSKSNGKTYSYVLAMLDVFSRFLVLRPLIKKEAKEIAPHIESIFNIFGIPKKVQTDKGSEFKGEVKKSLESLGVKKVESSAYHPQSQGKIERSHGTWKTKIRFDLEEKSDTQWSSSLETYSSQYNSGAHQSLGRHSPFEVFFGRAPRDTPPKAEDVNMDEDTEVSESTIRFRIEKAKDIVEKARNAQTKAADKMQNSLLHSITITKVLL